MFQHTAARRRLVGNNANGRSENLFQHTAARRRLVLTSYPILLILKFQHTAARRRLGITVLVDMPPIDVSTHSRPKAAGAIRVRALWRVSCFNTQPPEGGWIQKRDVESTANNVSTHSRPKAAGLTAYGRIGAKSFNTQPPEGGWLLRQKKTSGIYGFNTQPPEGGWQTPSSNGSAIKLFQHTAARRRLVTLVVAKLLVVLFQHTAARRRLALRQKLTKKEREVSTHSRPKAAGCVVKKSKTKKISFNTQPPEGGWLA